MADKLTASVKDDNAVASSKSSNGIANENSKVFPTYARYPITMVRGEGSHLWDDQGRKYLDLMAGIAVTSLGHAPQQVKQALQAQLDQLWHVSNLFTIPAQEELGQVLTEVSGMGAAFFCNSGAEANEAAIKLARRYMQKIRGEDRYEVICFEGSFHGRTLATLTATGQAKVKDGFAPLPEGFKHAAYNDIASVRAAVTPKTAAVLIEFVQGEGGVCPADPAFVRDLAALCEQQGILLIADEIQTGVGRTGKLFSYEHYGITPDIVSLAKGLGGGFPIGALLGSEAVVEAFSAGTHGTTFGGNPLAATAGLVTLQTILAEGLSERAGRLGAWAMKRMQQKLGESSQVKAVRGLGLMIGIELSGPSAAVITRCHEAGLLVIPAGPNLVRLVPALNIPEELWQAGVDQLCDIILAD